MKKRKYKKKEKAKTLDHSVYVFHNTLFNFNLFIDAKYADDAMEKFDMCGMQNRDQWKIFVELGQQPTERKQNGKSKVF